MCIGQFIALASKPFDFALAEPIRKFRTRANPLEQILAKVSGLDERWKIATPR